METVLTVLLVVVGALLLFKVTKVVFKVAIIVVLAFLILAYINQGEMFDRTKEVVNKTADKVIETFISKE